MANENETVTAPAKKKRGGRPKGSKNKVKKAGRPASKRIGRPPGTKNKPGRPVGKKRGRKPGFSPKVSVSSGSFSSQINSLRAEKEKLQLNIEKIDKAISLLSSL